MEVSYHNKRICLNLKVNMLRFSDLHGYALLMVVFVSIMLMNFYHVLEGNFCKASIYLTLNG